MWHNKKWVNLESLPSNSEFNTVVYDKNEIYSLLGGESAFFSTILFFDFHFLWKLQKKERKFIQSLIF